MVLTGCKRRAALVLVLLVDFGLTITVSEANDDRTYAPAPAEVAPLRNLLEVVHQQYPGDILEVELEQETFGDSDIWVYEVKMLTRRGRVYELEYDAVTLELLDIEGAAGVPHGAEQGED